MICAVIGAALLSFFGKEARVDTGLSAGQGYGMSFTSVTVMPTMPTAISHRWR